MRAGKVDWGRCRGWLFLSAQEMVVLALPRPIGDKSIYISFPLVDCSEFPEYLLNPSASSLVESWLGFTPDNKLKHLRRS